MKATDVLNKLAAISPGDPIPASQLRRLAQYVAAMLPEDDSLVIRYADDHIAFRINPDCRLLPGHAPQPFQLSIGEDEAHWSCTAGRVWERGGALAVSAASDIAIAATSWIYVPVTISTSGSVTAGAITATTSAEPAYWDRNGSNETVINFILGKIAVSAGVASIEYNTTGDRWIGDKAGQTVAPSHANNPVALHDAFNDTGTYDSSTDLLVKRGTLEGSTPSQRIRMYVTPTSMPGYGNIPPTGEANEDYGGIMTWCVTSNSASYDTLLDDTIDWRQRILRSSMATSGSASSTPSDNLKYTGWPGSSVNLVTDGTYQLYVDAGGDLRISANAAADPVIITVVAGGRACACPEASRALNLDVTLDGTFTLELLNSGCYGGGSAPTSHSHAYSGTCNMQFAAECPGSNMYQAELADLGNGWRAVIALQSNPDDGWNVVLAIINYDDNGIITNGGSSQVAAWVAAGYYKGAGALDAVGDYGTLARVSSLCNGAGTTSDGTIGVEVTNA